jgi:bifunctional UDP-N-acetylglucosamine pyrophosphorylase / glucosamine-1-phosphate N-acetyltransferase
MNRKIAVLIREGGTSAGPKPAGGTFAQGLLGRTPLSLLLDAASALRPSVILVAADREGYGPECAFEESRTFAGRKIPVKVVPPAVLRGASGRGTLSVIKGSLLALAKFRAGDVLVIPADRPLLQTRTMVLLLAAHRKNRCALTLMGLGPSSSSRMDLDQDSAAAFRAEDVLPLVSASVWGKAGQGISRLADILTERGKRVGLIGPPEGAEAFKVARPADMAKAVKALKDRKAESLARRGVTLLDPDNTWIDWDVEVGAGTVVYPMSVLEGLTRVGRDCRIYPHVHVMDSDIGDRAKVFGSTVLEECVLEPDTQVGPFSRLRPGTLVRTGSRVGNFVEMKNTVFGPRSKALHLSYLGDSLVEDGVNIGAGTITCNYDGARKNRTHIESEVFIGSGTQLIAPVKVGRKAYVAAGSTITKDVPEGSLAIARARQVEKPGWVADRLKALKKKTRP